MYDFYQVAKLTGHSYRVLYLAMSPDGESIVTGAGDETLRSAPILFIENIEMFNVFNSFLPFQVLERVQ